METKSMKQHMGMRAANTISNTIIHVLLVIISVIWLIPFVCIVLQSLRVESTWQVGYILPKQWGLDNFKNLLNTNFPKWYLNTFIIAVVAAALQTIIVLCMSYTLSRFRFKLRVINQLVCFRELFFNPMVYLKLIDQRFKGRTFFKISLITRIILNDFRLCDSLCQFTIAVIQRFEFIEHFFLP